jgi:hypothetical protein
MEIADLSAPKEIVGGHLPLEENERAQLFPRVAVPHAPIVDFQRNFARGAYGAGYEFRQIHAYDFPDAESEPARPYALCDLICFVHAGRDGVALEVDGLALFLGSDLRQEFVWQARGDASDPSERRRGAWQSGLCLPPGEWMLARGENRNSLLVIPWSAYTLDGFDLSYFVGRTHAVALAGSQKFPSLSLLGGSASDGLAVALARGYYRLNWGSGAGPGWGRNTYEFRCRLAWGVIDESTAGCLARAYRRPPRVEVGMPERVQGPVALRCWPDHFNYAPGDTVRVEIEVAPEPKEEARVPATAEMRVQHRGRSVGTPQQVDLTRTPGGRWRAVWNWTAPEAAGGGYLVSARFLGTKEAVEASPVVVEVLRRPEDLSRAVRTAVIAELYPDREVESLADRLVAARINVAFLRNIFHNGQYTGPLDGSWSAGEGCQMGDIGRAVHVDGDHFRRFIEACHARGITVIVYANLRNIEESQYAQAYAEGALGPADVDLNARRWPWPDEVNFRGRSESPRWEHYLTDQLTDGMRRFGYDGYFFDNTSYVNSSEAEMAHRILKATRAARPDQFVVENPGPALGTPGQGIQWREPRDVEIPRWPEVGCVQMEQEAIDTPDEILSFSRFYRDANDAKTPTMYMNDPTRRSPEAHLLRLSYLLAGKATDTLCVGNSTHDGAVFFEQCPVSAALTRTLYEGMALHPELLEAGPLLQGVEVHGLEAGAVQAYDGLAVGGRARTVIIANRAGWDAPLRNVGSYWDGPTPAVRPATKVVVTLPWPRPRPILGCWLIRPEGWNQVPWQSGSSEDLITIEIGEVGELAALIVRC